MEHPARQVAISTHLLNLNIFLCSHSKLSPDTQHMSLTHHHHYSIHKASTAGGKEASNMHTRWHLT